MTLHPNTALLRPLMVAAMCVLASCGRRQGLAERCASRYPKPPDSEVVTDTGVIPASATLPLFQPNDSLPQIYASDSSEARFRSLFYADFDNFRSEREVHSFMTRFSARIVGRDTAGWYAVVIPDPGPDSALFSLLNHCIGATHGVYVRSAYSRLPVYLRRD